MANLLSTTVNGQLNTGNVIDLGYTVNGSIATTDFRGINFHSFSDGQYLIGKRAGAWTQPLDITFYTGIKYHAHRAYGGHKFYTGGFDSDFAFSIGDGDNLVRVADRIIVNGTMNVNYDQVWTSSGNLHLQYSGSGNIDMNYGGGYAFSRTSLRAPIFYDYNDTNYYLDPNGTSNLLQLNTATRARWNMPRAWFDRSSRTSDQGYWTGTNGWAASDGTWANAWQGGFSGWDIWGEGIDHPQSGQGYVHAQGIVSGQHYATSSVGYGWMMVGAHNATANRYWLRGKWDTTTSGWVEMITTGNIASQSVSYAVTSGTSSATTQTNFSELSIGGLGVATREYVTSQGYLTSLPSHNHDDRYYTETEVNNLLSGKLSSDSDSEQAVGGNTFRFNLGGNRANIDPRWNESGYDADLGVFHMYATTSAGATWGRTGIALYNGSAYQYLTTRSGTTGIFLNNQEIIHSGNIGSQSVASATDASTLGGFGRGNTTNKIAYFDGTRNLYVNNPESYTGEVRLGAAWSRGGVYASGTLSMSTSGGAIDFVSNDTTVGAFRWDSTNGSRFIVGQNVTTTPHTLIDSNRRPVIYARGAYPVLTLDHTETGNSVHGPTIQFVHNGLEGRQFVIGTNGYGTQLDFGYSDTPNYGNTSYNPHNGIGGYNGKTIMRLTTTGLLIGDSGTYPTIRTAARDLDVRGSQNISGVLNVNGATEHAINDNNRVVGSSTNNTVFINGSIQLTNNNDAIVIGRGTSTFLSDEELGFGWGGGWYMTEGSYIRSRGSKSLHMNGGSVDYVGSLYLEGSGTAAHLQPNAGSYGSLQVSGSKNSWHGIRFTGSNVNLMMNANEIGFHNNDAGWQFLWSAGTAYVYKGGTGGGTQATVLDSSNASYAWNMNQNVRTSDPVTFAAYFLPQNPVGTTYGNGVSTTPPNRIEQRVGDNDGWRIYGEAAATNEVRMVFELIDDLETAYSDQWVFRNKLTYSSFTARNEFQISGNGDAQARSSMRAPIFYSSVDTNYFWEPNVSSAHRFRTANGYVDIGPMNSSWCHFQTDRANFYFGSTVYADASGFATYGGSTSMTKTDINSPIFLVPSHSDNTKGYRIYNTSNSSVSAMFVNSSNQLVIAAGAVDQVNFNKKVLVNGVALGVNVAPSATAGRIDASNDIVAYSSSDERLKQNITPIANALDKVKSLTGVEFDWKPEHKGAHGHEGHDTGIIAQQVLGVMPSAVRTNDTGYLAVRYEKLIGLLIEGMKEQQAQIDELKAKLDGPAR